MNHNVAVDAFAVHHRGRFVSSAERDHRDSIREVEAMGGQRIWKKLPRILRNDAPPV